METASVSAETGASPPNPLRRPRRRAVLSRGRRAVLFRFVQWTVVWITRIAAQRPPLRERYSPPSRVPTITCDEFTGDAQTVWMCSRERASCVDDQVAPRSLLRKTIPPDRRQPVACGDVPAQVAVRAA